MNQTDKRFDNWDVDCNECANYWTNSCDGVSKGVKKPCNSFLAQRNVSIPLEIKALRGRLKRCEVCLFITDVVLLIYIIGGIAKFW